MKHASWITRATFFEIAVYKKTVVCPAEIHTANKLGLPRKFMVIYNNYFTQLKSTMTALFSFITPFLVAMPQITLTTEGLGETLGALIDRHVIVGFIASIQINKT